MRLTGCQVRMHPTKQSSILLQMPGMPVGKPA